MIFYRAKRGGAQLSLRVARAVTLGSLLAYPAGTITLAAAENFLASVIGYSLILAALIGVAVMMGSSLQRVVGEHVSRLDEYELKLRSRAVGASYTFVCLLAILAVLYCAIASEFGGWLPDSPEEFNGIFWGVFITVSLLPSTFLAWQMDRSDAQPEE